PNLMVSQFLQNPFMMNLIRNGAPVDLHYDYSSELFRISTFAKFPANVGVSERSLARAGFYYTGIGDKVQCFLCNITLENWQPGDCPAERHRRQSPSCTFIQGIPSSASLLSSSHSAFSPPVQSLSALQTSTSPPSIQIEELSYFSHTFSSMPLRSLEDLCHRSNLSSNLNMRREQDRLDTFQNWNVSNIMPSELAKAGFYYTGQSDRVMCFSCGGTLSNWEPGDRAVVEHQRHYPQCRFMRGERTENVPLAPLCVSNPVMQLYEERLATFINWPTRIPVRPDQLAKAGFYYVGRNDDVKCFCCDGGLRCWESGDDPWVEHAKWFPRCEYLLQERGQDFVHQIQARFPLCRCVICVNETIFGVLIIGFEEERSEDAVMMNTPIVKAALEMGFERNLVKQTVQSKILATGENYKTVQDLVTDLLSAQDEKREEENERIAEEMASGIYLVLGGETIQSVFIKPPILSLCITSLFVSYWFRTFSEHLNYAISLKALFICRYLPMEEQLRRLQEERTCKVCMDKEVNIVFIPCGHLVVCKECAPSLRKCPICRSVVKGTVRTFLS
uniref:RING-type E3 ubiquitin transferase n=1 Tax=Erpetoichthys calabaricus TaxID=27687 RepID=A0A8C4S7A9_ERPCA